MMTDWGTHGPGVWDSWQPPDPGTIAFLPEYYYFVDTPDFPSDLAHRITARTVARWCDQFEAAPEYWGKDQRKGQLPADADERAAFIDELFTSFARFTSPERSILAGGLALRSGERWLLDAHDGFPGPVYLNQEQFQELQRAWELAGLPRNLYYPMDQRRYVVEPVEHQQSGIYVRQPRFYSPLRWEHRNHAAIETRPIASEEERRKRFARAAATFREAVWLRYAELSEPGRGLSPDRSMLINLMAWLHAVEGGRESYIGQIPLRPTAGWSEPPTAFQSLESALPALRRRHPHGEVLRLNGDDPISNGRGGSWFVELFDPERGRNFEYTIVVGVPYDRPAQWRPERRFHSSPGEPIARCGDERPPAYIDSDAAIRISDEAGGNAFRERTGADDARLMLSWSRDHDGPTWHVSYTRWSTWATMTITLDARDGTILSVDVNEPPANAIVVSTE